jgi:hypothetical protein
VLKMTGCSLACSSSWKVPDMQVELHATVACGTHAVKQTVRRLRITGCIQQGNLRVMRAPTYTESKQSTV